jgi:hypothetical protein
VLDGDAAGPIRGHVMQQRRLLVCFFASDGKEVSVKTISFFP